MDRTDNQHCQAIDRSRDDRIAELLERSIAAARESYLTHREGKAVTEGFKDRALMGAPVPLAHALLQQGDSGSLALAAQIIEELLDSQERHPRHPHRGNWPRWVGDDDVTDLNSAPFILRWLIPLLLEQGHQLPADLLDRCRDSVGLALEELERMDVSVIYTNIDLMSIFALIVGGEFLEDMHYQDVGKQRWLQWLRFTTESGAPREYNSTTYLGMDVTMLDKFIQFTQDPEVLLQATLMHERVWLHAALHYHRGTGRLAGPHARTYWGPMQSGRALLTEVLWRETGWLWTIAPGPYKGGEMSELPCSLELALTDHRIPEVARQWFERKNSPTHYEVRETASVTEGHDLTSYFTPSYALGTASRTYSMNTGCLAMELMANYLIMHYRRPNHDGGWGMMYSRYVVNDRHHGTLRSFRDRPAFNFFDQGNFAGVQVQNKAIGLYALMPQPDELVSSLKTSVVFQSGPELERVWLNDSEVDVEDAPVSVQHSDWLIVEDGSVYAAIHFLEPSCLGRETPIELERGPQGELFVSAYNYRGMPKRFWDYGSLGGAFWRGNLRAGFVVEIAERSDYASTLEFYGHLRSVDLSDHVDEQHIRTVVYRSGGDELVISYDLWNTQPKERWINGEKYHPPSLSSPIAAQGASGRLVLDDAVLVTNPQPVWLVAQDTDDERRSWVAVNPLDRPTPVTLDTPLGTVSAEMWDMGRLEWSELAGGGSQLRIVGRSAPTGLSVPDGVAVEVIDHRR